MNEVPMYLFIILSLLAFGTMFASLKVKYPINLIAGILTLMFSFFLSRTSINGKLVQTYGGITNTDVITTGDYIIQNATMGWIFLFMAIVSVLILIKIALDEANYQITPETGG